MRAIADSDFNKNFLISLGLHILLIALAAVSGQVMSKYFGNNDVEIIRSAIRVDVVGMPKFTVQELKDLEKDANLPKEPEVAPGVKVETKPEEKVEDVIKKDDLVIKEVDKEKKKSSFLNVLNEYSTKKVSAKEQKKGKKDGVANKNLESLVIEGNRLSQGSSLTGDFTDGPQGPFAAYVGNIPGIVRPNWKLPQFLLERNLQCRIRIHLDPEGRLVKLEVVQASGDDDYDKLAEDAIRRSRFPKPSDAIAEQLSIRGIILGFPL